MQFTVAEVARLWITPKIQTLGEFGYVGKKLGKMFCSTDQFRTVVVALFLAVFITGCQPELEPLIELPTSKFETGEIESTIQTISTDHLPNAVRIHPNVISGGLPADDAAFEELVSLGVKTVISVDGAKPDVETAKRHGLKYVHLPHGYDAIPESRQQQLAKAVQELEGPVYIHCHQGKHRSPAAASVACVGAGLIAPAQATTVLEIAGTSPDNRGLFRSVREATRYDEQMLRDLEFNFQPIAEVPPLAEAMIGLETVFHRLQEFSESGWQALAHHSDISPAYEALLLREHFGELLRSEEVAKRPTQYSDWLLQSMDAAKEMETLLQSKSINREQLNQLDQAIGQHSEFATRRLDQLLEIISQDCTSCHQKYRNPDAKVGNH